MPENTVNVIYGATFLVSDRHGDARASAIPRDAHGLFYKDVRHLSEFVLSVRDAPVELLSTDDTDYYAASFFFALDTGLVRRFHRSSEVSLMRKRNLLGILREEITLQNHSRRDLPVELEFRFAADFADLFEVKYDRAEKSGLLERCCGEDFILFCYVREGFERRTQVRFRVPETASLHLDCPDASEEPVRASVAFEVPARSGWTMAVDVLPSEGEESEKSHHGHSLGLARNRLREDLERWRLDCPTLHSGSEPLKRGWDQSIEDLAALRFVDDGAHDEEVIAAGLPWFMALFGRDSLISGY